MVARCGRSIGALRPQVPGEGSRDGDVRIGGKTGGVIRKQGACDAHGSASSGGELGYLQGG